MRRLRPVAVWSALTANRLMMRKTPAERVVLLGAVLLLLAVIATCLHYSRWGRFVRGISTFVVANESTMQVHNVRISFLAAGSGRIRRIFDAIAPGESRAIPVHTSDLMLDRLDYTINGEEYSYAEGGIACPGERFILSISGAGQVTTSYGR